MIRLGKLALYYCEECNIPLLKSKCSCGKEAVHVKLTPPGDVRPAFEYDKKIVSETIREQFGSCYMPRVMLMNSVPAIDKSDEIIIDGKVAGLFYYDIFSKKFYFQSRPWYASLLEVKKGYVIADKGAEKAILKNSNLMAPGVKDVDGEVKRGDEVVVLNEDGEVIATGKAFMDAEEMNGRGMAVKIRWRGKEKAEKKEGKSWKDVIKENEDVIRSIQGRAVTFIKNIIEKYRLPSVVSFSGGKDSLATLLLTLDAGYEMPLLFIDTGLEFEETIKHVHEIVDAYGLQLIEGKAGRKFWDSLPFFGPPARDFRWCCKTCKLGVASQLIKENFAGGILSFIGQRRYESFNRAKHGKVWKNPWVHGQIGASPIQNWTALHIWLYLFMKKARWNKLYEQGFARIGCWLCPACDMAEFELKKHRDWQIFNESLITFSKKHALPKEWIDLGLWRWRRKPKWSPVDYVIEEKREYNIEGNEKRIENFLGILGEVKKRGKKYVVNEVKIEIGREIKASSNEKVIKDIIYRAINCVGCGVCISKCNSNAIYIKNGKAWINEHCIHCMQCMDECPVIVFK